MANITPVSEQSTSLSVESKAYPATQVDADLAALAATADQLSGDFIGTPLRYEKGKWFKQLAKDKRIEIAPGAEFSVDVLSYAHGYVKWEKRKPVFKALARPIDGFKLPARNQLPDQDEDRWPVNSRGQQEDPWVQTNQVTMRDCSDDTLVTWVTTSRGGRQALGALLKTYAREAKKHSNLMPVVQLASREEQNPDFGPILKPVLQIIDWRAFGEDAAPGGDPTARLPVLPTQTSVVVPMQRNAKSVPGDDMDDDIPF
jgi:hypothetical protein